MAKQPEETLELGLTKAVRAPWTTLDEPRRFKDKSGKENGEPKYSASFLLPEDHEDLKSHKTAVLKMLKDKYGDKVSFANGFCYLAKKDSDGEDVKVKLKLPFSSGDQEANKAMETGKDRTYCAGHTILKTSSQYPVPVFDARHKAANGEPICVEEPADIKKLVYGGCFVAAQVKYRCYDAVGEGKPGVTAYLQKVCFVHDGDKIKGAGASGDVFSAVQGAVTTEDPTAGEGIGDDDIPF